MLIFRSSPTTRWTGLDIVNDDSPRHSHDVCAGDAPNSNNRQSSGTQHSSEQVDCQFALGICPVTTINLQFAVNAIIGKRQLGWQVLHDPCFSQLDLVESAFSASARSTELAVLAATLEYTETLDSDRNKNSSGDEIANVNFYAVRPEGTRIR